MKIVAVFVYILLILASTIVHTSFDLLFLSSKPFMSMAWYFGHLKPRGQTGSLYHV
jgi:hypothetical protein